MSLPARLKHIDSLKKENQIDYTAALFLMYISSSLSILFGMFGMIWLRLSIVNKLKY